MLNVTIGEINTTPNDFEGNYKQIKQGFLSASKHGDHLYVTPELGLCGYLVQDYMFNKDFIRQNQFWLNELQALTVGHDTYLVIGYIDNNMTGVGKPFKNMAAVLHNGSIIATYQKQLLPFYDVFDEGRYYEPGKELAIFNIGDEKIGITICEDIWNDKEQKRYNYEKNPVRKYAKAEVDTLVNLSASPFVVGKPHVRTRMLRRIAEDYNMNIVYANQIGGQDELVFDGRSIIVNKRGSLLAASNHALGDSSSNTIFAKINGDSGAGLVSVDTTDETEDALMIGLRDYIVKSGFKKVVVGSSGGIDSAVVLTLACKVLGPENVTAIMMPSEYSSEGSVTDAEQLHKNLGCKEYTVPIKEVHNVFRGMMDAFSDAGEVHSVADENAQARLRGDIVMWYSNAFGALTLTTGNKTELALGYCTLYGDMNGGYAPINDLYKMEVFALAKKWKEVPDAIVTKPPSAELAPGQTDEASLLPYPILDPIVKVYIEEYIGDFETYMKYAKKHCLPTKIVEDNVVVFDLTQEMYDKMIRRINMQEFKRRQAAPGIKRSKIAFGTGRRVPIVKK